MRRRRGLRHEPSNRRTPRISAIVLCLAQWQQPCLPNLPSSRRSRRTETTRESQPREGKRRDLRNPQRLTRVWAVFERTLAQRRRQRHARPKADRTNGAANARRTDEGWMPARSSSPSSAGSWLSSSVFRRRQCIGEGNGECVKIGTYPKYLSSVLVLLWTSLTTWLRFDSRTAVVNM